MAYYQVKDATIYYEVEGSGDPLIFIHGMGLSHVNWRPQVDFFKNRGYKTITFDIRGHGRSSETAIESKRESFIKQTTKDIRGLLRGLHIQSGIFIGYSSGTVLVQDLAITFPELTKGLVLTGAFPSISNLYLYGKFAGAMGLAYMKAKKVLENGVARSNGKDIEQIQIFRNEATKVRRKEAIRLLSASLAFDCRKKLPDIQVPLLVTYGGNERHMMKYRHEYLTLAPNVEVCLFPHVNHATLTKCTEQYNSVLLDFFESVYGRKGDHFLNPNRIQPTPTPMNNNLV